MTQIGTPPNILVSEFLNDNNLPPFRLFDFTPIGSMIFVAGTAFMALIGRRLLPVRNVAEETSSQSAADLEKHYRLREGIFHLKVQRGSMLEGKTLSESRFGTFLGVTVMGITRGDRTLLAPDPSERMAGGDKLIVKGRVDPLDEARSWQHLEVQKGHVHLETAFAKDLELREVVISERSPVEGKTLKELDFRNRFDVMVLAVLRDGTIRRTRLQDMPLREGDTLLLYGRPSQLENISREESFVDYRSIEPADLSERYHLNERLITVRLPESSTLVGKTLKQSRIGKSLGMNVICIQGEDGSMRLPDPLEPLQPGDKLIVEGREEDLQLLKGLNELEIDRRPPETMQKLLSEDVGLIETVLSPRASIAGRTLRQLNFREKYGLNVLTIYRRGQAFSEDLADMALDFGDALLLYGPRERIRLLGREPDFIVLTKFAQKIPRLEKTKLAALIMIATFVPVLLGWIPIYIATVVGAATMVLSRCLTMEEAYRHIEWKAVFLIAGMFPLGIALDQSGAARFLAEGLVTAVGPFGPRVVLLGLVFLTFLATCFIPTAALVVLLAPIVLNTSVQVGVSPQSLLMAIAMAASASFMTPISHPANILVMGPGGYRFFDYLKIGGLLTLVVFVVINLFVPILWPFQP
jgi:di/tricarboxylate transporter